MESPVTEMAAPDDQAPSTDAEVLPRLVDGVRLMPADFGLPGESKRFFLAVRPGGEYLRLTRRAHDLVALLHDAGPGMSYADATRALSERWHTPLDAGTVRDLVQTIVAPTGLLRGVPQTAFGRGSMLSFRIPLLPRRLVRFLTGALIWLYTPVLAAPIALAAFGITIFVSASLLPHEGIAAPQAIGWAYLYALVSVIWHEFGHASACRRFRAPNGPIGFGLYFIYPAFYTDVTGAWQLPRRQRAVVDVGGIYFQSMVLVLLFGLYLANGAQDQGLRLGMVLITGMLIFSLNPFLRFDGYWVLNDLLGLTALERLHGAIVVALIGALRSCVPHPMRALRELSHNLARIVPRSTPLRYKLLLVVYLAGAQVFWFWFLFALGSWALRLVSTYPAEFQQFLQLLSHQRWTDALPLLSSLILPGFILFGLVTMVVRLTRRGRQTLTQKIDVTDALKRTW